MLYPIITDSRGIIELNGIWNFKLDEGEGFNEKWYASKLADTMNMAVPASYNDLGVTADIRNHVGFVWYEREFTVPSLLLSQRIVLRFGSATHEAKVYVNGVLVAQHKGAVLFMVVEDADGKTREVASPGLSRFEQAHPGK